MHGKYNSSEELQRRWDEYEGYDSEPRLRNEYSFYPELDDDLFDNKYLLKARVRRNMKRIRKQYVDRSDRANPHRSHWTHLYKHA
jgi:hypothetical protein